MPARCSTVSPEERRRHGDRTTLARATSPSQRAEGLTVRANDVTIDGDEPEGHGVTGHPFEVVEQRPMEIPAYVDAVSQASGQPLECTVGVGDTRRVVVSGHAVLRDHDGHAGVRGRQADGVLQGFGVDLPARLHGEGPLRRRDGPVGTDALPRVGLHADEVVIPSHLEPVDRGPLQGLLTAAARRRRPPGGRPVRGSSRPWRCRGPT